MTRPDHETHKRETADEHKQAKAEDARRTQQDTSKPVDKPKPKPTAQQTGEALHGSLKEMVRCAEAAGQRDQPHVVKAKEALALAEPEEKAKDD